MAGTRFKHLYPKLKLVARPKLRHLEDRIDAIENDIRDLRGVIRELITVLERELGRDLDQDKMIGRVSPKRGLPKIARLPVPAVKSKPRAESLPMNLP